MGQAIIAAIMAAAPKRGEFATARNSAKNSDFLTSN